MASIAAIVGLLLRLNVKASDIGDAFMPVGLIILLSVAVLVLLTTLLILARRQRQSFSPADQLLLDRMLGVLSRPVMREWGTHDFSHSWPRDLLLPIEEFRHEFRDVEHRFDDAKLDAARARLTAAADEFADVMGDEAFPAREGRLNLGWPEAEIEGDPRREQIFLDRQRNLLKARRDFTEAHDTFVRTAKERQFDISAVSGTAQRRRWDEPDFTTR